MNQGGGGNLAAWVLSQGDVCMQYRSPRTGRSSRLVNEPESFQNHIMLSGETVLPMWGRDGDWV